MSRAGRAVPPEPVPDAAIVEALAGAAPWERITLRARGREDHSFAAGDVASRRRRSFHCPYLAGILERSDGGPVAASRQELVGALRELRSIRRQLTGTRSRPAPSTLDWIDANISRARTALAAGEATVELPRCGRCERRPRWFGELCKRCADEVGERPEGKV